MFDVVYFSVDFVCFGFIYSLSGRWFRLVVLLVIVIGCFILRLEFSCALLVSWDLFMSELCLLLLFGLEYYLRDGCCCLSSLHFVDLCFGVGVSWCCFAIWDFGGFS